MSLMICNTIRRATTPFLQLQHLRMRSSIKFVEERGQAQESVFFRQQDDQVLKNLLDNHPEYDPRYTTSVADDESMKLVTDITSVFAKHGTPKPSLALIKDLSIAYESNGWKKPSL